MRPFGADRLRHLPDGTFLLICPISKGWSARLPKTLTSPEHPGTAVRWEGELFEVLEATAEEGGALRYRLALWEDRHTVRVVEGYDEQSEAVRASERDARRQALRKRRLSILLAPLLGHLPGRVQRGMERDCGAPARAMTIASALPLLVLGALGVLAFLISSFGGGSASLAGWPIPPLPLAVFLAAESSVRLGVAFLHGEPIGSVAGAIADSIGRVSRDLVARSRRRYASGPKSGKETP